MKFRSYVNEEEKVKKEPKSKSVSKKKVRVSLKSQLSKLDAGIDKLMDDIENEIEKIEENPTFKHKISQMLINSEKENGEMLIAMRSLINTLSRSASIIPDTRGHAQGVPGDNIEVTKDNSPKIITKKDIEKTAAKVTK